ncbi:MAG: MerR family transcriptional regulator [Acidobacteriota bacterium]
MNRPEKLFYKRAEVCQIAEIPQHTLRVWEAEFALQPVKNASGQVLYHKRDKDLVLKIKSLVYEEGLTIPGAKKRLESEAPAPHAPTPPVRDPATELLLEVRKDLKALLTLLSGSDTNSIVGT